MKRAPSLDSIEERLSAANEFKRRLQRVYPKVNTNLDLPFEER